MSEAIQASRLGDILLEKGLLNLDQLREAMAQQGRQRLDAEPDSKHPSEASSLGEILIALGYITRQQLKRGLNWQLYLRKMTLMLSLCAPLMNWIGGGQGALRTGGSQGNNIFRVSGRVMLKWDMPRSREDGSSLDVSELGGYELRYRKLDDQDFSYISINDPWKNQFQFRNLQGDYLIEVAAFDRNGVYSKFVPLPPIDAA